MAIQRQCAYTSEKSSAPTFGDELRTAVARS
jgi:hypothetical protein